MAGTTRTPRGRWIDESLNARAGRAAMLTFSRERLPLDLAIRE